MRHGLLLHFPFDSDERGKVTDVGGRGNHGTVVGARWTADGKVGGGYAFADKRQYILVPRQLSLGQSFTVALWVNAGHFNNSYPLLIGDRGRGFVWHGMGAPDYPSHMRGRICFYTGSSSDVTRRAFRMDSAVVPENQWHFLAVVVDEERSFLYQDGGEVARTAMQKAVFKGQARAIEIGAPSTGSRPEKQFNGTLDEIMIWSRALSPDEIGQLYRRGGIADAPGQERSESQIQR